MSVFTAWVSFSATGAKLAPFRDEMRARHLHCAAQQIRGETLFAKLRAKHWQTLQALAEDYDIRLTVIHRHGLRFPLRRYRMRYGVLAGILLSGVFLWWSNRTIRSIEIYGNAALSDTVVLTALEELGVARGCSYQNMNFTQIEQKLRLRLPAIEWVTVWHTGGRLVVDLREERLPPARTETRIPTNYLATVTAQITSMKVLGGEAVVQVGDAVQAGQLLISGVVEDKRGNTFYHHADGVVTGIYETDLCLEQPFCVETVVKGETVTETVWECFGKRIPLSVGFTPPAEPFSYAEQRSPCTLFGKRLPFSVIRCSYVKQESQIVVYSMQEIMTMQEEAAERYEQNFHSHDKIIGKDYQQTVTDLGITLKIHYVFEGVIGKTSEIFVK